MQTLSLTKPFVHFFTITSTIQLRIGSGVMITGIPVPGLLNGLFLGVILFHNLCFSIVFQPPDSLKLLGFITSVIDASLTIIKKSKPGFSI